MILTCETKTTSWPLKLTSDILPFHKYTHTSIQPSPPAHPVSRHSFPASVTSVRPVSLLEDGAISATTHIHFSSCLFICLCRFVFCLHAVCLSAPYTPLLSQSDVLTLNLSPLTAFLRSVYVLQSVGFLLSTDPPSTSSELHLNFVETFWLTLLF